MPRIQPIAMCLLALLLGGCQQSLISWEVNELRRAGRQAEAEALARRALVIAENEYGLDHLEVAEALDDLARVLPAENSREEEALYRRALAIKRTAYGEEHAEYARALHAVAASLMIQGRFDEAEPLFRRVLEIEERTLGPSESLAASVANYAQLLMMLQRLPEAEEPSRHALEMVERVAGRDAFLTSSLLISRASILQAQGREEEAEQVLRRAVPIVERSLGVTHAGFADGLASVANANRRLGRHEEALAFHRRATAIYARRLAAAGEIAAEERARRAQQKRAGSALHRHIGSAMQVASATAPENRGALHIEAFQLVDLAKGASIASSVARMAARFSMGSGPLADLARQQQDAIAALAIADTDLLRMVALPPKERDMAAEARLRDRSAALRGRIAELADLLRREFPSYAEIADPRPLSIADAQGLLGTDEALVAFSVGTDATHLFALRRDRFIADTVQLTAAELTDSVGMLRMGLDPTGKSHLGRMDPFDAAEAHSLFLKLFGPAAELLTGARHLLVVPDGALESLPIGVLLTEAPSKPRIAPGDIDAFRSAPWLATRLAVSVLPSVGSLRALRQFAREARAPKPFMGIGDPLLLKHPLGPGVPLAAPQTSMEPRGGTWTSVAERPSLRGLYRGAGSDPASLRTLPSLPDTAGELLAMAQAMDVHRDGETPLLLREAATESAVKRATLNEHRVLAFATHGVIAGEIEGIVEPALVLTPPDVATAEDDGLLTAAEVAQLKLDADWVILSACNTAAPDGSPGAEGLSGLAKAFFYAGARALLVSHWPVVSNAAVALTTTMLNEASKPGVERAEAHRRAMQALIQGQSRPEHAHPLFWAPFVLVGEGGTASRRAM